VLVLDLSDPNCHGPQKRAIQVTSAMALQGDRELFCKLEAGFQLDGPLLRAMTE